VECHGVHIVRQGTGRVNFSVLKLQVTLVFIYQSARRHILQDSIHLYCGETITTHSLSVYSNEGRYVVDIIIQLLGLLSSGSSLCLPSVHYTLLLSLLVCQQVSGIARSYRGMSSVCYI